MRSERDTKANYKYTFLFIDKRLSNEKRYRLIASAKWDKSKNQLVAMQTSHNEKFIREHIDEISNISIKNNKIVTKDVDISKYNYRVIRDNGLMAQMYVILHKVIAIETGEFLGYLVYDTKTYRPVLMTIEHIFLAQLSGVIVNNGEVRADEYLNLKMYPTRMRHSIIKIETTRFYRYAYKTDKEGRYEYNGYIFEIAESNNYMDKHGYRSLTIMDNFKQIKTPLIFKRNTLGYNLSLADFSITSNYLYLDYESWKSYVVHGTSEYRLIQKAPTIEKDKLSNTIAKMELLGILIDRSIILVK